MLKFITLGGFLGAGKTTTMTSAATLMRDQNRRVAVITNDAGDRLVDTATASHVGVPVREVTGGCFCCNFDDLAEVTFELVRKHMLCTVIAEAVGSCTDITATVIRPLRRFYGDQIDVAPLTAVVDPARYLTLLSGNGGHADHRELGWLMHKQLEDAEIIAINKIDVAPAGDVERVAAEISRRYPGARVQRYSAATGDGMAELLDAWAGSHTPRQTTIEIDYQRYGKAEALLAWLDQDVDITASDSAGFDPDTWAERLLSRLASDCASKGILIGHVKLVLRGDHGETKASATGARAMALDDAPVTFDRRHDRLTPAASAVINARVACTPAVLQELVATAIDFAAEATSSTARVTNSSSFTPAQPKPTHRITSPV